MLKQSIQKQLTTMSCRGRGKRKKQDDGWGETGYMAAKVQKLQDQVRGDQGSLDIKSDIFKGVAVFVNGYTKPSAFELKQLVSTNGGVFHHYYSLDRVSHIIASNLPNSKVANLSDNKKVCSPDWIVDSIAAGRLLPYQDYLLYSAKSKIQPGIAFKNVSHKPIDETCTNLDNTKDVSIGLQNEKDNSTTKDTNDFSTNSVQPILDTTSSLGSIAPDGNVPVKVSPEIKDSSKGQVSTKPNTFRSPSKSGDPNFVAEFYNNSRLHHLSTWSAEFKAYVRELQKLDDNFPGREKLREFAGQKTVSKNVRRLSMNKAVGLKRPGLQRVIMHIDMDCFFVSVGLQNKPDLIGKPVAVTHSTGKSASDRPGMNIPLEKAHYEKKRMSGIGTSTDDHVGFLTEDSIESDQKDKDSVVQNKNNVKTFHSMAEIASCSYEARAMGVKNGMFMGKARQLCPNLETIPYDFEGYNRVSRTLYDTVAKYTHEIEAVSCDEMFIDCADLLADTGISQDEFAKILRAEIKDKTQCNASVGMGPNILIARLATRVAKPNGQYFVAEENVKDFVKDKAIKDLPGVGRSTSNKLHQKLNIVTCGEMQAISLDVLQKELGPKTGQSLYNSSRGIDSRPIASEKERKSVSAEINYGIRFTTIEDAEKFVNSLADEVHSRMQKICAKGKTITFKAKVRKEGAPKETAKFLGHGICDNIAKSTTLPMATDNPKTIAKEVLAILHSLKVSPDDFRGLGIQVSRLETGTVKGGNTPSILNFTTTKIKSSEGSLETKTPKCAPHDTIVDVAESSSDPPVDNVKNLSQGSPNSDHNDIRIDTTQEQNIRTTPKSTLPPLPMLPNFSESPESSFSELLTINKSKTLSEVNKDTWKTTVRTTDSVITADFMLPSPSQIDPHVLGELPPEIRLQIQSALKEKISSRSGGSEESNVHHSQEAGCSHWQNEGLQTIHEEYESNEIPNRPAVNEPIVALPSYSQIDPACLAALPPDMQDELKKAYASENKRDVQSTDNLVASGVHPLMAVLNSPHKKQSPGKSPSKGKRLSPHFKVPRGRPPGSKSKKLSPKKLDYKHQPRINEVKKPSFIDAVKEEQVDQLGVMEPQAHAQNIHEAPPIGLCGAVTLADVKVLMKEWVNSTEAPEEEDLTQFVSYLADLIQDKNLEMVYLVILYLKRLLRKKDSEIWSKGGSYVLHQIQDLVKCVHGGTLAV